MTRLEAAVREVLNTAANHVSDDDFECHPEFRMQHRKAFTEAVRRYMDLVVESHDDCRKCGGTGNFVDGDDPGFAGKSVPCDGICGESCAMPRRLFMSTSHHVVCDLPAGHLDSGDPNHEGAIRWSWSR